MRSLPATLAGVALCAAAASPTHSPAAETRPAGHEHVEQILVTASPLERDADDLAVPVSLFTREHLIEHLGPTLGETLQYEPGITTTGFAPGASRPIIRGQDAFRVRTLENGIGTHDVSVLSADHDLPINPLAARSVEIVRGPSTLRYGGGAIGGVVNSISDRVPRALADRPLTGELLGGYGFNGNQRDAAFLLDGRAGPLGLHLDGARRESSDYELPESSRQERFTDTDGYSIAGGAALIGERGRFGLGVSRYDNEYGIPAPEEAPLSIDLESERYMLEADWNEPLPGLSALRLRGAFTDYEHREIENEEEVGSSFDNEEWEARLEALHAPLEQLSGALGLHVGHRDLDASGEGGELLAPSKTRMLAAYLFEELPLGDRFTLQLGGRVERTELEGTPFESEREREEDFTPLSGSAGLVVDLMQGTSLGLTLGAAQRAPDTLELFARGPHEASETFEIGDPGLDEETSYTADLRLHVHRDRWEAEASVFYFAYRDFTFGEFTGNSRDEDGTQFPDLESGELRELAFVQDDATFYGAELAGHVDLLDVAGATLGVDGQFDFVRGRLDHGNVPRIPPIRWGAGVFVSHPRASARVGFFRAEEQDRLGAFETDTDAYTYLNASLSVLLLQAAGGRDLELSVTGTNLTDEDARNHVSLKKDDVLLPGRALRVSLRGRF